MTRDATTRMREPTPDAEAYAWWRAALAGQRPPMHDGEPQCGFYRRKLVKGGPWVPATIYLYAEIDENGDLASDEMHVCLLNGQMVDAREQWSWLCGNPITYAEYRELQRRNIEIEAARSDGPRPLDLLAASPPTF